MPLDEPAWWYRQGTGGVAAWLSPLGSAYGWATVSRYSRSTPYRSSLPVICVGNFTAGGTGKTPLVLHLCHCLRSAGRNPVALTRGYGGRQAGPHWVGDADGADDVGDEALLLARAVPTLVSRNRAAGARVAEAAPAPPADVLVMDDGLQNPSLRKDLTLAVVDGVRGLGNGLVIPAGPLRAPLSFQLGLADAIIVNAPAGNGSVHVTEWLRRRFTGPVLQSSTVVAEDATWLRGQRIVAWVGIGSPQRFFSTLQAQAAEIRASVKFRDHQRLTETDAERLLSLAGRLQADLVSTEKDLARLKNATGKRGELAAATRPLPIRLDFTQADAERLAALLDSAIKVPRDR